MSIFMLLSLLPPLHRYTLHLQGSKYLSLFISAMSFGDEGGIDARLDQLQQSIAAGRRDESLALLEALRDAVSPSRARSRHSTVGLGAASSPTRAATATLVSFAPSASRAVPLPATVFRADGDATRYAAAGGGIRDPLLGLEAALRRQYECGGDQRAYVAEASGVSAFLTDIIASPVEVPSPSSSAKKKGSAIRRSRVSSAPLTATPQAADSPAAAPLSIIEEAPDRRDLETPFPFHRAAAGSAGPHATLLERLYALLRFGKGSTCAYLLDTMNGDTQAAVLGESAEPGIRCTPFADRLVKELTTRVVVSDTCVPRERTWEGDAINAKLDARARRFPLLAAATSTSNSNGGNSALPPIDERLDFAVDRPVGVLEALEALLPGAASCRSGCGKASPRQLLPPARGRACDAFVTSEWAEVSIAPWACCVTSYALASVCPITGGSPPRHWVLEAAHGSGPWTVLREHNGDEEISRRRNYAVWDVPAPLRTVVANKFRIRRTGADARGGETLQIAHIELYGRLMACWPNGMAPMEGRAEDFGATAAADVPPTRFVIAPPVPLPPEPVGRVTKKKKK